MAHHFRDGRDRFVTGVAALLAARPRRDFQEVDILGITFLCHGGLAHVKKISANRFFDNI